MSARGLAALAAVAALAGSAGLVFAALHRPAQSPVRLTGTPVALRTSLSPAEPQFGDSVVATIDVFVDTQRVDVRTVKLAARFEPFSVTSSSRSTRRTGGVTRLRVVDVIDCLDAVCAPQGAPHTFRLPRLRVTYPGGARVAAWPPLRVHPRVVAADVAHPQLRVDPPQARAHYRFSPAATGWALMALAATCAIGGLGLLVRLVVPALPSHRRLQRTPLEELLDELASGRANGDVGRRRTALEELARALQPLDEPLSYETRVLAWASDEPAPAAIADLALRARTVMIP
jgi:hypothetical protein